MSGTVRKVYAGLEGLRGHDVEVRVQGGACVRGVLSALDPTYLYVLKHTGRGVVIARAQVSMVSDETTLIPRDEREAVEVEA